MKKHLKFADLVKKNREELLKDNRILEKIEKRVDEKYTKPKS